MTTSFDTDQNTQAAATVASAWASSPFGQPEHEAGFGFADEGVADETVAAQTVAEERLPTSKHAFIALALAGGIGAGAALGLMFSDFKPDHPVIVPGSTTPEHAVVVTETGQPAEDVLDVFVPTTIAPAPAGKPADVGTPPVSAPAQSTVVDVPTQEAPAPQNPADQGEPEAPVDPEAPLDPEEPADPNPEPPGPENPNPWVPDDLDIANDNPVGPDPTPEFEPPIALPSPQPDPPTMPDFDIKAGPNS